jgi:hypothetical protein
MADEHASRRPHSTQLPYLAAAAEGRVLLHPRADGARYSLLEPGLDGALVPRPATPGVQTLLGRGWLQIAHQDAGNRVLSGARVVTTREGHRHLDDARLLAAYDQMPEADRPRMTITNRTNATDPFNPGAAGRDLSCWDCYRGPTHPRGPRASLVWHTALMGRDGDRAAEAARARHAVAHQGRERFAAVLHRPPPARRPAAVR